MHPVDAKENGEFADHDLTAARGAKIQIMRGSKKPGVHHIFHAFP